MTTTVELPRLTAADREAIALCLRDTKAIMRSEGANRGALERVSARLIALAGRRDLFRYERFPVLEAERKSRSSVYLLAEDDDRANALFAVSEIEGNMSPPHDHTTWAVIAGIEGEETNRFYERLDDGAAEGRAEIRQTREEVVKAGTAVAMTPSDIHSIHCFAAAPTLNFHLYGRSIAHLPGRKMFDMRNGTCRVFPPRGVIHRL